MAKKKIYAVRKGHKTGLFNTWAECQKATAGYSGAEFRGFTEKEEALAFLNMETTKTVSEDKSKEAAGVVEVPENMVIPQKSVVVGVPAKIIKKTSESQVSDILSNADHYVKLSKKLD